jgi:hypothetical protein
MVIRVGDRLSGPPRVWVRPRPAKPEQQEKPARPSPESVDRELGEVLRSLAEVLAKLRQPTP